MVQNALPIACTIQLDSVHNYMSVLHRKALSYVVAVPKIPASQMFCPWLVLLCCLSIAIKNARMLCFASPDSGCVVYKQAARTVDPTGRSWNRLMTAINQPDFVRSQEVAEQDTSSQILEETEYSEKKEAAVPSGT